jgi:hypothetical protein
MVRGGKIDRDNARNLAIAVLPEVSDTPLVKNGVGRTNIPDNFSYSTMVEPHW